MATRKDWYELVEKERLPPNEEYETDDGKTICIEYREDNGKIYKSTKTLEKRICKVLPIVAERKKWKKFGNAKYDPPGINSATTKVGDEFKMDFLSRINDEIILEMAQKILGIQCRRCKGRHLTAKCPHKDHLPEIMEQPPQITSKMTTTTPMTLDTPSTRKYIPPAKRPGASSVHDAEKQNDATIRVSNLPDETEEPDLRELFQHYGRITRIYLAKDRTTNISRGFAFITFDEKRNAQMAMDCLNSYGYGHLILQIEWAPNK